MKRDRIKLRAYFKATIITVIFGTLLPVTAYSQTPKAIEWLIQKLYSERKMPPFAARGWFYEKWTKVRYERFAEAEQKFAIAEQKFTIAELVKIGKPAVIPLIAELDEKNTSPHLGVVDALVAIDTAAVESLIAALNDSNVNVRGNAATVLGQIKDLRAVEPLIATLNDLNVNVRMNAAMALGQLKDLRAVEPLINALTDESVGVVYRVVNALAKLNDTRAVEPLIAAFKLSKSEDIARALGKMADTRAVEPLIAALKDWRQVGAIAVAKALAEIGDPRAAEPLVAAWKSAFDANKTAHRRHETHPRYTLFESQIKYAIRKIGKPAVAALILLLENEGFEVQREVREILLQMRDVRVIESLLILLQEDRLEVTSNFVETLGESGDAQAVEPLIKILKDKKSNFREEAAIALGKIKDTRAVKPLMALFKNKKSSESERSSAASALAKFPEPRVVKLLLTALLNEEESGVRASAVAALGEIKNPSTVDALINVLDDNIVNQAAVIALTEIGQPAVIPVIAALNDENSNVVENAAQILGNIGEAQAIEPLYTVLNDNRSLDTSAWTDTYVRNVVASAMMKIGISQIDHLNAVVEHGNQETREMAVELLSQIDVEHLLTALKSTSTDIRRFTAKALGIKRDTRSVEALTLALKDENYNVREGAASALMEIGVSKTDLLIEFILRGYNDAALKAQVALIKKGTSVIDPLIAATYNLEEKSGIYHGRAREILDLLIPPERRGLKAFSSARTIRIVVNENYDEADYYSLPFFITARKYFRYAQIKVVESDATGFDCTLRIEAKGQGEGRNYRIPFKSELEYYKTGARLWGKFSLEMSSTKPYQESFTGIANVARYLDDISKSSYYYPYRLSDAFELSNFKEELIEMIGKIYGVKPLLACLKESESSLRESVTANLLELGREDKAAVPHLIKALKYNEGYVREVAATVLGQIKDKRAIMPLTRLLNDNNADVRAKAEKALKKIRN